MIPIAPPHSTLPAPTVRVLLADPALHDRLMRQAYALLLRRQLPQKQDAAELVAETQARALRCEAKYDPSQEIGAWLHGILTRVYWEYGRAARKLPAQLHPEFDPVAENIPELSEFDVSTLLDHLSPEDRFIVEECYLHDRSHQDVAAELGIRPGTSRQRLRRALNQLRHIVGGEGNR